MPRFCVNMPRVCSRPHCNLLNRFSSAVNDDAWQMLEAIDLSRVMRALQHSLSVSPTVLS